MALHDDMGIPSHTHATKATPSWAQECVDALGMELGAGRTLIVQQLSALSYLSSPMEEQICNLEFQERKRDFTATLAGSFRAAPTALVLVMEHGKATCPNASQQNAALHLQPMQYRV